jgi:ABC-2 type transport system permease protein
VKALLMAGASLRRLARDRLALCFLVLLPVVVILIVGLAFGDASRRLPVGVVDEGAGPLGSELRVELEASPALDARGYADADAVRRAVRRGVVAAGVVLPAGYDQALRAGRPAEVVFVTDQTRPAPFPVRSAVAAVMARQAAQVKARVEVEAVTVGGRTDALPTGFNYTAPANLVLFVFITSLAGAAALIEARRLGVTRRLLATPTTVAAILFGEALGRFAVALLQGLIIFLVGLGVFGVDWGDPPAALLLLVTFALVATGVGMLLGSVLRNADQANSIGPPVGIALGMLGGCMWPLAVVPAPMRAVGHLFPQAWAMDGFIALIARDAGLAGITRQLAILAAFAAALLALASWRLRRTLVG